MTYDDYITPEQWQLLRLFKVKEITRGRVTIEFHYEPHGMRARLAMADHQIPRAVMQELQALLEDALDEEDLDYLHGPRA